MEKPKDNSPERRAFDSAYRLRRINNLRRLWGLPDTKLIVDDVELGATVGIEIEMTWLQAFRDMQPSWKDSDLRPRDLDIDSAAYRNFSDEYDKNDIRLKPLLHQAESLIPRAGVDAYWEFSFLPSRSVDIILAEVETLYEKDILNEGQEYATHLTLAGVDTEEDAFTIAVLLERSGGTSPARLNEAVGWARKGKGGLLRRKPHELLGEDISAYELRTLISSSPAQLRTVLCMAQYLQRLIKTDPQRWEDIKADLKLEFLQHGLSWTVWRSPALDSDMWRSYGKYINTQSADHNLVQ